jgi:hypothetical protein
MGFDAEDKAVGDGDFNLVALRSGPRTRTLVSSPFGPRRVTVSSAAYWPGCLTAFMRVRVVP